MILFNPIIKYLIVFQTIAECIYDKSNVNESLVIPFISGEKRLEIPNKFEISIKDLVIQSKLNGNSGGAIRFIQPFIETIINNTIFFNNSVDGNGGVIFYDTTYPLNINNCSFFNSNATLSGGTVSANTQKSISINNCISENSNSGSTGGTFNLISIENITIKNLESKNSTSTSNGGTLLIQSTGQVNIEDSVIIDSKSNINGGIGFIISPMVNISKNWFKNSQSISYGGCFHFSGSSIASYNIFDCYFENCFSTNNYGGTIYITLSNSNLCFTIIKECTFLKCISSTSGSVLFVSISRLQLTFEKVCCSLCNQSNGYSGNLGGVIHAESNNNDLLKLNLVSIYQSGFKSSCYGVINLQRSQHYCNSLNLTYVTSYSSVCGAFSPQYVSTYQYFNLINGSSFKNNFINFSPTTSIKVDFDYSNILLNDSPSNGIYYTYSSNINLFSIRYGILINNNISNYLLYSNNNYLQTARNCYIVHIGNIYYGFQQDFCISTLINTPTYIITHYSTYLCLTPNELGQNEIIISQNCQTLPPIPTSCFFETNNELFLISSMNSIFPLFFIYFY